MVLPRPSWSGFTREPRAYSTSAVLPLPFVNMDSSKLSTMYTCILLAAEQRKKCRWYCTTIKFDLPLEKTREMVLVEGQLTLLSGVNIRLGGFHYTCFRTDITMEQTCAHVFLKTAGGVTRGHGIYLSNQAEPAHPFERGMPLPEPGKSTLNVLNYKYKYFPPQKYLSTSTFLFGEMYLSTFRVLSKCT